MICCVTGHRPKGFPFSYDLEDSYFLIYLDVLKDTVEELMYEGYDHFISGMADGVDLDFASSVASLSNEFEGIVLESALPYPLHTPIDPSEDDMVRNTLVTQSQKITVVSPKYFNGCMQKRNRYMVDSSDLVLVVWNGEKRGGTWYTINYALKKGKPVKYIMLKELSLEQREKSFEKYLLTAKVGDILEEGSVCSDEINSFIPQAKQAVQFKAFSSGRRWIVKTNNFLRF